MLIRNNTYRGIKKRREKIIIGVFSVGIVAGALLFMGRDIYKGNIDGYSIVYEEDRLSKRGVDHLQENRMTIQKGDTTYIFEDSIMIF